MATPKSKVRTSQFEFGPWKLTATESHILKSEGEDREKFEKELELPNVPEMIFAENVLRLQHASGFGLEFNALDALKRVDAHNDLLKVAATKAWREARQDCEHINEVVKPYDWTYTTDYCGTCLGQDLFTIEETDERIDMEKLKVREQIHFYADILLFEDELGDNGHSMLSVKIRVMPSSFFILLRFYMRVDDVLVRVNDTRIHYEAKNNYIFREYTSRESSIEGLKMPEFDTFLAHLGVCPQVGTHVLLDPNEIGQHLPIKMSRYEKLVFPSSESESSSGVSSSSSQGSTANTN